MVKLQKEGGRRYLAFPAAISLLSSLPSFPLPSEVRDSIPCTSQRWNLLIQVYNYIQLRFIFLWEAFTEAMKTDLPHVENEIFKLNISLIINSIFLTCLHFWNGKHLIFDVNRSLPFATSQSNAVCPWSTVGVSMHRRWLLTKTGLHS